MSAPAPATTPPDLPRLRTELDGLDDALHELVMRRAAVVSQIGALAVKGAVKIRPGREAAIIRRLLDRHAGPYPRPSLAVLWRQLINGNTALQGPFTLAVCDTDPARAYTAAAREHFGPLTPLRSYRTPAQAIGDVSAGQATAAILPLPLEGEPAAAAWWTALLHRDDPRIHVIARLPFWAAPRPPGGAVQALVVCAAPPDPSGHDRSLLGLEVPPEQSRARLTQDLLAAGFNAGATILRRDPAITRVLAEVAGFVTDADPRLQALTTNGRPPIVLGAYAVPIGGDTP